MSRLVRQRPMLIVQPILVRHVYHHVLHARLQQLVLHVLLGTISI